MIKDLVKSKQKIQLRQFKQKQKAQQEKLTQLLMKKLLESTRPPEPVQVGSMPYGLPTVALTRRTIDTCIRAKQLEMVNNKMINVMSRPHDFIKLDDAVESQKKKKNKNNLN